jgi:hypothetical protein
MASILEAQAQAFKLANPNTVFNPDAAIAKKWLELKQSGTFIGVPIGPEISLDDVVVDGSGAHQTAQAFTSGVVLVWRGGAQVDLA